MLWWVVLMDEVFKVCCAVCCEFLVKVIEFCLIVCWWSEGWVVGIYKVFFSYVMSDWEVLLLLDWVVMCCRQLKKVGKLFS